MEWKERSSGVGVEEGNWAEGKERVFPLQNDELDQPMVTATNSRYVNLI